MAKTEEEIVQESFDSIMVVVTPLTVAQRNESIARVRRSLVTLQKKDVDLAEFSRIKRDYPTETSSL